jgi:hypothetical protein
MTMLDFEAQFPLGSGVALEFVLQQLWRIVEGHILAAQGNPVSSTGVMEPVGDRHIGASR